MPDVYTGIAVDLQDGARLALVIAHEPLAALHDHEAAVPAGMREFSLSVAVAFKVQADLNGEFRAILAPATLV
jgi:hypothetical protein